jgi:hypothetical protein
MSSCIMETWRQYVLLCMYCICIPHFHKKDQMTAECATIYIIYKMKGTLRRID